MSKKLGILIFIYIFVFLLLGIKCEAQSQYSAIITKMETSLFGMDYSSQNDEARLKRIEEVVYGQPSSKTVSQRVNKLSTDLSADLIGQEVKPKRDTFAEDDDTPIEKAPKADSNVNYPIVNNLEKKVFNKEFKTVEIHQRLANLEQNVFKKTFNDDLSARVERLKLAVMPERAMRTSDSEDDNQNSIEDMLPHSAQSPDDLDNQGLNSRIPSYNAQNSVLDDYQGNSDIVIPLSALERSILKKSFPNDTVSNRLTRLELKIFNSTFIDDDEQTRFDRVSSAYQAQKTSKKYDSNKLTQHMSTAVQLGAILLLVLAAIL